MDQPVPDQPAERAELIQLGQALGENLSFALIGGRCTAAQAETMLRLRESRVYLRCESSWKDFCPKHLHISASQADRFIRLWQLHGPAIFELRQLIRISPEAFNAVEPFIKENALHFNDEAIELDPQNSQKIARAVDEFRRTMPPKDKPALTVRDRLNSLQKQVQTIVSDLYKIVELEFQAEERRDFGLTFNCLTSNLERIGTEHSLFPTEPRP